MVCFIMAMMLPMKTMVHTENRPISSLTKMAACSTNKSKRVHSAVRL